MLLFGNFDCLYLTEQKFRTSVEFYISVIKILKFFFFFLEYTIFYIVQLVVHAHCVDRRKVTWLEY